MENINILLWAIGGAFGIIFALLLIIWNSVKDVEKSLGYRIDKLDEKLTDVDRRLCRLEGAFASKDCCMIKDDRHLRNAE
jgi:hypothetical protein